MLDLDEGTASGRENTKNTQFKFPKDVVETLRAGITMPWGLWSSAASDGGKDKGQDSKSTDSAPTQSQPRADRNSASASAAPPPPPPAAPVTPATTPVPVNSKTSSIWGSKNIDWNDSLNRIDWKHYTEPRNLGLSLVTTSAALGIWIFWRAYLRRFPGAGYIAPGWFGRRSLLGKVTSVGDGDGFHLFHTPGGRLAGWGWLRKVPTNKKELRGRTIPIRLAGIDAPEGAHWGKPAQPFSGEATTALRDMILGRRVRAYLYRKDQYDRIVAGVYVRRPPFFFPRKDVGLELLRQGLATTYEAKTGVEFGGPMKERQYKAVEAVARQKGRGMWSVEKPGFFSLRKKGELESPMAFKRRMREEDAAAAAAVAAAAGAAKPVSGKKPETPVAAAAAAAVAAGTKAAVKAAAIAKAAARTATATGKKAGKK